MDHICVSSYREARSREQPYDELLLYDCQILNTVNGLLTGEACVLIGDNGKITALLSNEYIDVHGDAFVGTRIDCQGMVIMPGLIDCHVHCTAFTANLPGMLEVPESLTALRAERVLEGMLSRGFTTVRDCGGADWGLAQAVDEGTILGPKILFTGHALSQTGGHGDMRSKGEDCFACGAALRGIGRVCDGDAAVRVAARDELRRGAHCIKVMASGGVSSPTDRLTNTQFSMGELKAIVEEAAAAGTYVTAHAYTDEAVVRAIEAGVQCIEHGNMITANTAHRMERGRVSLVPTLVTYYMLKNSGLEAGMKPELVEKVGDLLEQGLNALKHAKDKQVRICFGSDLLGSLHEHQLKEFEICSAVLSPLENIQSATINPAELFGMSNQIGQVGKNFVADLLLVDGNPVEDINLLTNPDNLKLIIKEGRIVKNTLE